MLLCVGAAADPLHEIDDGHHQHEDSGWIFMKEIAGFTLVGMPYTVEGSTHVTAHYQQSVDGKRFAAVVHVYPPEAVAADATLEGAERTLAAKWKGDPGGNQLVNVADQPSLKATKVSFATASTAVLYFIDTGRWIVRIEATGEGIDSTALDAFARQQNWNSFGLTDETCTGAACDTKN